MTARPLTDHDLHDRKAEHLADWADDPVLLCEWCDEQIPEPINSDQFEENDGPICEACFNSIFAETGAT